MNSTHGRSARSDADSISVHAPFDVVTSTQNDCSRCSDMETHNAMSTSVRRRTHVRDVVRARQEKAKYCMHGAIRRHAACTTPSFAIDESIDRQPRKRLLGEEGCEGGREEHAFRRGGGRVGGERAP
jgi:hypothetical protein